MKRFLCIVLAFASVVSAAAKPVTFTSPDGHLKATIETGAQFTWSLERDGEVLIAPSGAPAPVSAQPKSAASQRR